MIGSSITEVAQTIGPPFSVKVIGQRAYEYTYVDRYTLGGEFLYENRYILTVVNGQVVDKRVESVESPPYDELYQMDPNYPSYP